MIGKRFNKLTVIKEVEPFVQPSGQKQKAFLCYCDCGQKKVIRKSHLNHGKTKSCGCLNGGLHGDTGTKLHTTWRGMLNRARGTAYNRNHCYIDKGVSIYNEWLFYPNFKKWAKSVGYKNGLQIDRIDNNGNYEPNNCRFVTAELNCNNKDNTFFVSYKGEEVALKLLLKKLKLSNKYYTIYRRLKRGWNIEKALTFKK